MKVTHSNEQKDIDTLQHKNNSISGGRFGGNVFSGGKFSEMNNLRECTSCLDNEWSSVIGQSGHAHTSLTTCCTSPEWRSSRAISEKEWSCLCTRTSADTIE